MPVPNHSLVPRRLFETDLYNLLTHEGQGAYVDAVVSTLHMVDPRWGHLRKRGGQTNIHGHGEDAALYKFSDGTALAVDFIAGAGGSNPQPGWGVGTFVYKHDDWMDPTKHGEVVAVPIPPQYPPYPQPEDPLDAAGVALFADFAEAGQPPNPQMFRFAFRVAYSWLTKEVPSLQASIDKHRKEWRAILGLPPL